MNPKPTQYIMLWLLPILVIGGLFAPLLGFLVIAMMVFFLVLSFFKARYWCWHYCPRGSFLDVVIAKITLNRPIPPVCNRPWFRWTVLIVLMGFLSVRLLSVGASVVGIGSVFVGMCVLTTLLAIVFGFLTKPRMWCVICPMGHLQEHLGKAGKKVLNNSIRQGGSNESRT